MNDNSDAKRGGRRLSAAVLVMTFILVLPVLGIPAQTAEAVPGAFDKTEQKLLAGIDVQNAMDIATWVSQGKEKRVGTDIDLATADMLESKFKEIGLQNVRKEMFEVVVEELISADEVGYAIDGLRIITPADAPRKELLTTLYSGTPGTPPEGITAEMIDVGLGTNLDFEKAGDVSGKIVFMQREDYVWAWNTMQVYQAAAWGAAAVVFYGCMGKYPLDDAIKQDSVGGPIPGFSISRNDANYLKSLLAEDTVVLRLYAETDTRLGHAYNVVGEIPGKKYPDQYIVLMAHYDNWWISYNDDCTGIGAMIDLAQNIMKNYKNDRTIIILATSGEEAGLPGTEWFNWLTGAYAFVNSHPELEDRLIGVLNLDVISADTVFYFDATPELRWLCDSVVRDLKLNGRIFPWMQDTWQDSWVFAQVGFPSVHLWSWGTFYDNIYHTDLDTIEYTIPRSIEITEQVYLLMLYRLDSSKILPYRFDETHSISWQNQLFLKATGRNLMPTIDFSVVDEALANFAAANAELTRALSKAEKVDDATAAKINDRLLAATRLANTVIYEVAGEALWDVQYRGTEYVETASLMSSVAFFLEQGNVKRAAALLSTYTTMSYGQLMAPEAYGRIFEDLTTDRAWGEVCVVDIVNVHEVWSSLSDKSGKRGQTVDVSAELEQVLGWYDWAIVKANEEMRTLANGLNAAAAEMMAAAALCG